MGAEEIIEFLKENAGKNYSCEELSIQLDISIPAVHSNLKLVIRDENIQANYIPHTTKNGRKRKRWLYAYKQRRG